MQTRTLGWRAAEAAVLGGFALAIGFEYPVALAVGLAALAVGLAEAAGERYDAATAARHATLAIVSGAFAALALVRGARWVALVAVPLACWFALDALARRSGATPRATETARGSHEPRAVDETGVDPDAFADADLAGECLRALRDEPRAPAALADGLGVETARVRQALAVLDARGTVERDDDGRYRLAGDAFDPFTLTVRLAERVADPLSRLRYSLL
ncbi:helix-turn-helix domain-containing protein [Halarchaeum nitratireducens]|uniref:Uncharacterized protein n=1 Tax=Halarchaeum nitratireducens TaxID=489913 RepID=A0A830GBP9_9EURY|nr:MULTISPECIES: hypothetical protein [Halarchaeum]MBP2250880.1 hypothetical protein [Halarchaeum solikamskense]GGN19614.1 hypothetical protein GCM10009021_20880 [Halarchaeum nitratireducens]